MTVAEPLDVCDRPVPVRAASGSPLELPAPALTRECSAWIAAECRLEVITGASHPFEEPGCLGEVALPAAEWFARHLHAETP